MENATIQKIMEFKNQITDIDGKLNDTINRAGQIKADIGSIRLRSGNTQGLDIMEGIADDITTKAEKTADTYKNIKALLPQAESIMPMLRNNPSGLGLNMAPVIGITAAAGTVIAGVYGLTKLLDPVEVALRKQDALLKLYENNDISESEYNHQANLITADLNNQNYEIQKSTGVNLPVVIAGAGTVYLAYKLLTKAGII